MTDNREIIDLKLGDKASSIDEDIIQMCIDEITTKIKEYCNINSIPDGLRYTHANMVVDLINYMVQTTGTGSGSTQGSVNVGEVTNVSLGDMKLTFGGSGSGGSHNGNLDSIIMNYTESLNKYRKAVWH